MQPAKRLTSISGGEPLEVGLSVIKSELVCLMGRNSAGKTTTVKGIARLIAKATGPIRPFMYDAAVGGTAGVKHAIGLLRDEVDRNMAMLGLLSTSEVTSECLVSRRAANRSCV